jgi:N-acetylglucosamine-6-phosphate deacetylase
MACMIIRGGKIYAQEKFLSQHEICIHEDTIKQVQPIDASKKADVFLKDDEFLIPTFTDLHIHGTHGQDVMDAQQESLQLIANNLLTEGVSGFLATTMTAAIEHIEAVLQICFEFKNTQQQGAQLLGVHLEGPFLSPEFAGAQADDYLSLPNIELLKNGSKNFLTLSSSSPLLLSFQAP